ncbi:type IV toxin-antitoxin system AbiEi family antitoxin domain-containing protein [Mycolicibacterium gadium]|nr:type IV toxin-antitoxin system AbiEi family antitoxin domain-containing protein [Mycolicibacterium gadium]
MLKDLLREQDGVITLEQATKSGLSVQAVQRRVQSGDWMRCSRGVYFVDDRPFTSAARVRAAVWGYGERAIASGLTAAWWHGLTRFAPGIVEVTMPRTGHGRCHEKTRLRRRDLEPSDVTSIRGLRVTARPLTVREASINRRAGMSLMDGALQEDVELRELWRAQLRNKGRYGSPAARILLQAAGDGARSAAERLLVKLLREAGITGWRTNLPVAGYKVDVGFPAERLAIETDGWAFHSDSDAFQVDRKRQNDISVLGWQVLRFTWLDLTEYPQRVIAIIRRAISVREQSAGDRQSTEITINGGGRSPRGRARRGAR